MQRVGAVGATIFALAFLLVSVSNAIVQPRLGIASPADRADPAKVLPVAGTLAVLFAIPLLYAIGVFLSALALDERLRDRAPARMRVATASGVGGAILFLASGMLAFTALPELASVNGQDSVAATGAALALGDGVARGLLSAGAFAAGWWVLLASSAGLAGGLPRPLGYVGLLFGVLSVLFFAAPPLGMIGGIVGIVWAAWLAWLLWRH